MGYNQKQYHAGLDFLTESDENVKNTWDSRRIQSYNLYENLYLNSTVSLKIVLRGDDQTPILMPAGKKIIEATHRFLGQGFNFFVDAGGDEGARQEVEFWWQNFFAREALAAKFTSNKRWGLIRGDAAFYIYADANKGLGSRVSIEELDPRQLFEIENPAKPNDVVGIHIVETIQDFREPEKENKKIAKRRTFRKQIDPASGASVGVTSELRFFEIGKWDDREVDAEIEEITEPADIVLQYGGEAEFTLPYPITELPVYKWRNIPPQNSTWGHSQLSGLETLLYGLNQSLSDEDATIVFQGLGMYVTTSGPPRDPTTGDITDWNIGPKQIIEIGQDQSFDRVTGVTDVSPFTQHMETIDKSVSEASGTPEIAIGRVDVSVAESGISLQMQLMPLLAQNSEKELEMITVLDQMFHDITTMWLPSYEPESFGNVDVMNQIRVVTIFDDPMPKNRDARIQEVVLLDQANLILKTMTIQELRDMGYKYPTVDIYGNPITDEQIAEMLLNQQAQLVAALDPYAGLGGAGGAAGEESGSDQGFSPNGQGNTPDEKTIDLGIT